jgi:hypothetical protein
MVDVGTVFWDHVVGCPFLFFYRQKLMRDYIENAGKGQNEKTESVQTGFRLMG